MTITKRLEQPEGRTLEFKEALPTQADLNKTMIAFANDAGGDLYVGVQDNPRKVIGVNENELLTIEEQLSNTIHDSCEPIINPEISFLKYQDKHLIEVKIHKGSAPPYYLKHKGVEKGTYIRVGSSNRLANIEIINELKRHKEQISFDSLPVFNLELRELDWHSFRNQFLEKTNETIDDVVLRKLGLANNEQGETRLNHAMLLLSDDPKRTQLFPYAKIECARFKGVVPGDFIDQKTIDVPISLQAEQAYQFILRHISQGSTYDGVYRKDRWEYPVIAIREAIRNAVIHRDYSLKGKDIKIAIFDDKVEITSPGKLLPTVDFNEMEAGQSDIRNKVLAPVFKKLGIIEQWGNGLQLISDELKPYPEIALKWSEPGMSFRLSFINLRFDKEQESRPITTDYDRLVPDSAGLVPDNRRIMPDYGRLRTITDDYARLDIEEQKILIYVLDNKIISRKEAVKFLNLKETKTKETFHKLLEKGLISREGEGRNTHYKLSNKDENQT
jgi:ATP-dependent DNA helicase RecG